MTKTFTFIEETHITKEGEKTFWYTKMQEDQGFASLVNDSLSYKKDEAKVMYDALYDCAVNPASTNYGFVAKVYN